MKLRILALLTTAVLAQPAWVPAASDPPREDWLPGPFQKLAEPILRPSAHGLDDKNVYNMAVIPNGHGLTMLYRGESKKEAKNDVTGRFFLATSTDGIEWNRETAPVLTGTEEYEKNGVEDPRLIRVDSTYYLTYTGYDGKVAHLCLATSSDLRHWQKRGPIFPHFPAGPGARYSENWTKSGAILPQKLRGRYLMVFGDTDLWQATSTDLLHWDYRPEPFMRPRPDHRDSALIEPGPPLRLTDKGILLLYNSADKANHYAMFGALLDAKEPTRVLARTDTPLLEPTLEWEKNGYVPYVVFGEALLQVGDDWFLYYGGADRNIGLARARGG